MSIFAILFVIACVITAIAQLFVKTKIKNTPAHMQISDIQQCIDLIGRPYSTIDCAIYFINNENDFVNYAQGTLEGFYNDYIDGSLHGLCCYHSNSTTKIFVFTNNTVNSYGLERCYYQKAIIRVLYHELRHAIQHINNLDVDDLEYDANWFAERIMKENESKINNIFKNYAFYD